MLAIIQSILHVMSALRSIVMLASHNPIYKSGRGPIITLATAIPTLPAATANNTYATVSAPLSKVRLPLELSGLPSSPIVMTSSGRGITTESEPVPKLAPTAILLQNSIVAQMNGIRPIMKTASVVSGLCCSIGTDCSGSS